MVFADIPIIVDVVFWIVALFIIFGCVAIISVNNIFKSAVFLALTMVSIAILYFLLSADFIGVIQILVYVGAVSVLIAFAVMLVKDVPNSNRTNKLINLSIIPSTIFLIILVFTIGAENWITKTSIDYEEPLGEIVVSNVSWIGELLVREYFISFQASGLILLAALIGALALLRRER
jgi:NADH-quinone oxidoreductase subunit J